MKRIENWYNTPMLLPKHKFLLLGIVLALVIGGGLAVLNHFVRAENSFHEADMALAYRTKSAPPIVPQAQSAPPTTAGSAAPTNPAPPPQ
jgi:hypothetical protein